MRVLFILHRFPPDSLGGADLYTYGIAKALSGLGHSVAVACLASAPPHRSGGRITYTDEAIDGCAVRRYQFDWQQLPSPYEALYVVNKPLERQLISYCKAIQPDVVHVTACETVSACAVTAPKKLGIPVILTLTGKWWICPAATLLRRTGENCRGRQSGLTCLTCMFGATRTSRALLRMPGVAQNIVPLLLGRSPFYRSSTSAPAFIRAIELRNRILPNLIQLADKILSPSYCHIQVHEQSGILPPESIIYQTHGYDFNFDEALSRKSKSTRMRFAFVGNVVYAKGVHLLLEAFNDLQSDFSLQVDIYGDTQLERCYSDKLMEQYNNSPEVCFHGRFEHSEVHRIFSNIDALVFPSLCVENSPLVIAEARATQTPIIGSDTCGVREWIRDGIDGLLFRRGDSVDLARQMRRCLSSPGLLHALGANGPRLKTARQEAQELLALYQQVRDDLT